AELDDVTEQDEPLDVAQRGEELRPDGLLAQEICALELSEMQIRDEGGRHAAGSAKRARRTFLSNFPTEVLGTSSMNSTRSGSHHFATLPSRKERIASASSATPSRDTTHAHGRSPQRSSDTAITAASSTSGWAMIEFSSSTEEIHSPPDLTRSLVRSISRR